MTDGRRDLTAATVGRAFPPPLWASQRRWLVRWTAIGVGLRLLLLPVGISTDLLAVYWRAHIIAFDGEVYREYLVNTGAHAVHALWLRIVQPLIGPADAVWTDPWFLEDGSRAGLVLEEFLAQPHAWRAILLLKLPYVLAELGAGLLLLRIVVARGPDRGAVADMAVRTRRARVVWAFWMLSPAGLYATVLFGRYEAYAVLAVVATLWLLERDRPWWAALAIAAGILTRTYPLVLVPFLALVARPTWRGRAAWAGLAVAPLAATMVVSRLFLGVAGELARTGEFSYADNYTSFALAPGAAPAILLLPAALGGLAVYLAGRQAAWWGPGPMTADTAWIWITVPLAVLFTFSEFSPHYLMWLTPAIALLVGRTPARGVLPLHAVQVVAAYTALALYYGVGLFTDVWGGLGIVGARLGPGFPDPPGLLSDVAWTGYVVVSLALVAVAVRDTRAAATPLPLLPPLATSDR